MKEYINIHFFGSFYKSRSIKLYCHLHTVVSSNKYNIIVVKYFLRIISKEIINDGINKSRNIWELKSLKMYLFFNSESSSYYHDFPAEGSSFYLFWIILKISMQNLIIKSEFKRISDFSWFSGGFQIPRAQIAGKGSQGSKSSLGHFWHPIHRAY